MGRKPEGKAEKMFKRLGKKIDELLNDIDQASDRAKHDYADRFEELNRNKESLKKEFSEFKEKHKDKWEEVESGIEKAGKEIKEAFDRAFKTKKEAK